MRKMKASRSATVPRGEGQGPAGNHRAGAGGDGGSIAYCIPIAARVAPTILRVPKPADYQGCLRLVPGVSPLTSCIYPISLQSSSFFSFFSLLFLSSQSPGRLCGRMMHKRPMPNNLLGAKVQRPSNVSALAALAALAAAVTASWSVHLFPCELSLHASSLTTLGHPVSLPDCRQCLSTLRRPVNMQSPSSGLSGLRLCCSRV